MAASEFKTEPLRSGVSSPQTKKSATTATATFAGGCFWCMEGPFQTIDGVQSVIPGYTGGDTDDPTYEEVCSGESGHLEAVQITYAPEKVDYETLLDVFWRQINPTDGGGQFVDRGSQYQTAIFFHDENQKKTAQTSIKKLEVSGRFSGKIVTEIRQAVRFYPAEDYHHSYHQKNPARYQHYRRFSGRDDYLKNTWGVVLKTIN